MKKDSQTIHRKHAEQKARRDKERAMAGYKGRSGKVGPSKTQENPLSNPFAQALAFALRLHNMQAQAKPQKRFERRRT